MKKVITDSLKMERKKEDDDISFIVLEPSMLDATSDLRVLMGGTSPGEEEEYQRRVLPERIFISGSVWMRWRRNHR